MSIPRAASFYNAEDNLILKIDDDYDGILIKEIDGIYKFEADISTSEYSQTHGSRYKTSRVPQRNIVITGQIYKNFHYNRQFLYRVFRPDSKGLFRYMEKDEDDRLADYYVESCEIEQDHEVGNYQISLICPDPFFYSANDITVNLASWTSGWVFPHEFLAEGEPMGERTSTMIDEIANLNGVSGIGLEITLTCSGDVLNPYVYLYETGERITIGTLEMPFTLTSTRSVVINTTTGKKSVVLIQNGVESSINEYLDPESEFFQLLAGINTIGYNASGGAEYLNVKVQYKMRYLGV